MVFSFGSFLFLARRISGESWTGIAYSRNSGIPRGSGLVEADDFDGEFDLVGLFVGIEFDEGLDIAVHDGGASLDEVLLFDFLLGILAPFDSLFLLVLVVIGKVKDFGVLELEGAYSGDGKLAFFKAFGGKDGNGFVGCLGGYFVDTSLDCFFLSA